VYLTLEYAGNLFVLAIRAKYLFSVYHGRRDAKVDQIYSWWYNHSYGFIPLLLYPREGGISTKDDERTLYAQGGLFGCTEYTGR